MRHKKKNGRIIDVEVIWHELLYRGRAAALVVANDLPTASGPKKRRADPNHQGRHTDRHSTQAMIHAVPENHFRRLARQRASNNPPARARAD